MDLVRESAAAVFATRLKELVSHRGVAEFARKCGIADATLRNYVAGRVEPTLKNLIRISRASGRSLDELAGLSSVSTSEDEL